MKSYFLLSTFTLLALFAGCSSKSTDRSAIQDALLFHASFDNGVDADFAKGDSTLYRLVMSRPDLVYEAGLPGEVTVEPNGKFGSHLHFNTPEGVSGTRAFYKLPGNFPYPPADWQGTISFWLKLTPDEDLRPGFTDPIQLTSKSALDAGIWVDFMDKNPRHFRMGIYPDKAVWNPEDKKMPDIPEEQKPWITYEYPPFSRDHWTHICMTIEGFNNQSTNALAKLYVDGKLHGELTGFQQTYTWELDKAQIRLGVNYRGSLDELSLFDRALSAAEVSTLYALDEGVTGLIAQ